MSQIQFSFVLMHILKTAGVTENTGVLQCSCKIYMGNPIVFRDDTTVLVGLFCVFLKTGLNLMYGRNSFCYQKPNTGI